MYWISDHARVFSMKRKKVLIQYAGHGHDLYVKIFNEGKYFTYASAKLKEEAFG